ncbi:hypothetical protein V7S43_012176 [Phytophthora oleae]|uniref:Elicitin n=1 Tax=Phytophthora oleae TaxID=2107226 RepID=A0ABD3F7S3_9STRA
MNVFSFIAVLAIVIIGSANASGSSSGSGNSTLQQSSAFVTLASLLNLSTFSGCATDSGYSHKTSTALPSDAEYSLIKSVISLNPPDCIMTVPTNGLTLNVYSLANGFSAKCW